MLKRVYLEITDACNLNCPFCENEKGHTFMSLERIKEALEMIRPHCSYIYLHVLGEPLLHPDFDKVLTLLDEKGFALQLVTNGILLDKHDLFAHPCLRKLSISVHAFNYLKAPEGYYDHLSKLIEDHGKAALELRFFETDRKDEEVSLFLKTISERYAPQATSRKGSLKIKENTYLLKNEMFHWPDIKDPVISETGYCHGGDEMIAILHNGEVVLCCMDPKGHTSIGNIFDTPLPDILKSPLYKEILDGYKEKKIRMDLCKRCSYRLRFSKQ